MPRCPPLPLLVALSLAGTGIPARADTPLPELAPERPAVRPAARPAPAPAAAPDPGPGTDVDLRGELVRRYGVLRHRDGSLRFRAEGFAAVIYPDGGLAFLARSVRYDAPAVALRFDVTDVAMRRRKQDPYAAAKIAFMNETRPFRMALRRAWQVRVEQAYLAQLPGRLAALWSRADLPAPARRALLHALWEECLEAAPDPASQRAQQARWMILQFVRTHLPRGSAQGFTDAELARYRQQRGGQVAFDPYGAAAPLPPAPMAPPER